METVTCHIVWFNCDNALYSNGKDFTGTDEIECLALWRVQNPTAIFHSMSKK